jgi:hypothetical protein
VLALYLQVLFQTEGIFQAILIFRFILVFALGHRAHFLGLDGGTEGYFGGVHLDLALLQERMDFLESFIGFSFGGNLCNLFVVHEGVLREVGRE